MPRGVSTWEVTVKDPETETEILHLVGKDKEEMTETINNKMRDLKLDNRIRVDQFAILHSPSHRAQRAKFAEKMDKWITVKKLHKYPSYQPKKKDVLETKPLENSDDSESEGENSEVEKMEQEQVVQELDSISKLIKNLLIDYNFSKFQREKLGNACENILGLKNNLVKTECKLIILDLNNVLIYREYQDHSVAGKADPKAKKDVEISLTELNLSNVIKPITVGNFQVWIRPGMVEFLEWLFSEYDVAVWSSVKQWNIEQLVKEIFPKVLAEGLKFVWHQDMCSEIPTTTSKPIFIKELSRVFEEFPGYDRSKVLLIDDNVEKCVLNKAENYYNPTPWSKQDIDSTCNVLKTAILSHF